MFLIKIEHHHADNLGLYFLFNWLTTPPIDQSGFTIQIGAFRDAIALRYGWLPSKLSSTGACGMLFTVEHAAGSVSIYSLQ